MRYQFLHYSHNNPTYFFNERQMAYSNCEKGEMNDGYFKNYDE